MNTLINILLISLYVFCVCYIIMLGLSVLTVVGVTFLCTNRNSRFLCLSSLSLNLLLLVPCARL